MTTAWLTPAWGAEVADALAPWAKATGDAAPPAAAPPAPVTVTFTVTGGPDGDATGALDLWPDGQGARREVGFTLPAGEARSLIAGDLAPSVAFMRGRLKTSGDAGAVLDVLAATATASWESARQQVAAVTDAP